MFADVKEQSKKRKEPEPPVASDWDSMSGELRAMLADTLISKQSPFRLTFLIGRRDMKTRNFECEYWEAK